MNKKNWLLVLSAFVVTVTSFSSCKKSNDNTEDKSTEWFQKAAYKGPQTSSAASFVIKNIAYVTTGQSNNAGSKPVNLKNTYAYDPASNTWSEKDPLADNNAESSGRRGAIAFAIGDFGYVGGGNDGANFLKDFYKFDPSAEKGKQWTKVADLPIVLANAVAFTIGGKAYVGTGETTIANGTSFTNQFFKYDPDLNKWEAIPDAPFAAKRKGAFVFVSGNTAYVGGGVSNGGYPADFYKFDGTKWTQLADLNRKDGTYSYDMTRSNAAAFVIGNSGFLVGGLKGTATSSVVKYNISGDYWTSDNTALGGGARQDAVAYTIQSIGYVATGLNGTTRFDDNWSFVPVY